MAEMESLVDTAVSIFIASLNLGFLFLLLWTIQQSLKRWIGKWSGVIYVVAILFYNPLMGLKTHVSPDETYVEFKVLEPGPWADGVLSAVSDFSLLPVVRLAAGQKNGGVRDERRL